ncbi:MAG: transposase [Spirochaetes bacterium]|nr:transposase [Spirochaetota bacterium]
MELHGSTLFGYKINPDHVHILLQTIPGANISKITGSLKRNFSRDINNLMLGKNLIRGQNNIYAGLSFIGADSNRRLLYDDRDQYSGTNPCPRPCNTGLMKHLQTMEKIINFNGGTDPEFPFFKWQKSYYYHLITDQRDYENHVMYIRKQWIKHGLPENKWCFTAVTDFSPPV